MPGVPLKPANQRGRTTALVPQNTRLWDMVVNLAKQKFNVYPSLPASKWVHQEYVNRGGHFVEGTKKDDRHDTTGKLKPKEKAADDKKKAADDKKKTKKKG